MTNAKQCLTASCDDCDLSPKACACVCHLGAKPLMVNNLKRFPISNKGHELLHHVSDDRDPVWVEDNEPIYLTLTMVGTCRGQSAAYFLWRDSIGRLWPCFITDMVDVLNACEVRRGRVSASWQVRKRGQNYGIALAVR